MRLQVWIQDKRKVIVMVAAVIFVLADIAYCAWPGSSKTEILHGVLLNQYLDKKVVKQMEEDVLQGIGGNASEEEVYLDASLTMELDNQNVDTVASMAKITTYVFGKELDFMIAEPDAVEHYANLNGLDNLHSCLPTGMYKELQEKELLYQETNAVSYGILLTGSEFAKQYGIELEQPVLCVVNNSMKKQEAVAMIQWILEKE